MNGRAVSPLFIVDMLIYKYYHILFEGCFIQRSILYSIEIAHARAAPYAGAPFVFGDRLLLMVAHENGLFIFGKCGATERPVDKKCGCWCFKCRELNRLVSSLGTTRT